MASDPIPEWALRQRHLIAAMNEAAPLYQQRYTRADGTFVWRETLAGHGRLGRRLRELSQLAALLCLGRRRQSFTPAAAVLWEAVTRQFTGYGQI